MEAIFERCNLDVSVFADLISNSEYDLVANPKALAAQTFRSKNIELRFLESKLWKQYSDLFQIQFLVQKAFAPLVRNVSDAEEWINYPYAVLTDAINSADAACAVWFDPCETRKNIRHIRIYNNEDIAFADNIKIKSVLSTL